MAGSSNFLQWNPTGANMENDSQYSADSQRQSGATSGAIFDDPLANKLFFQMSTGITALMQMMANKGYVCSDANLNQLAAVLSNLLTNADIPAPMQALSSTSQMGFYASAATGWDITMTGNVVSSSMANTTPGQVLTFIFRQGSTPYTFSPPASFASNWIQPPLTANSVSTIQYLVASDNSIRPIGGGMQVSN